MIKRFHINRITGKTVVGDVYSHDFVLPRDMGRITGMCASVEKVSGNDFRMDIFGNVYVSINNTEIIHNLNAKVIENAGKTRIAKN